MDSTSVALLARELIGAGAAEGPLHTLSLVYERLPQLARERPYIEKVLQGKQDIIAHRIPADDLLHYDAFAKAPPHDEPYPRFMGPANGAPHGRCNRRSRGRYHAHGARRG